MKEPSFVPFNGFWELVNQVPVLDPIGSEILSQKRDFLIQALRRAGVFDDGFDVIGHRILDEPRFLEETCNPKFKQFLIDTAINFFKAKHELNLTEKHTYWHWSIDRHIRTLYLKLEFHCETNDGYPYIHGSEYMDFRLQLNEGLY